MEMPIEQAPAAVTPGQTATGGRLQGFQLASVLAAIMVTLLLSALDQTIVGTALPTIVGELHGFSSYSWVLTSYLLTSTTMTPIVGKLSDQFGRKWFIVAGIIIFLVGSVLSGAAQTMNQLIIFRGLQGIGGGMILALVFTLVGDIFSPAERARWQGLFSGVFGLASVIGPTLGGYITDHINWRWVFYVNLPLGILALALIIIFLPINISPRNTTLTGWAAIARIDFAGALLAAGATVTLLLGLSWGGSTYPWDDGRVIGTLVAAGVLFIAFIVTELFVQNPILPLALFKNQVFASGAILSFLVGAALFATIIYLPLYVQGVLGQAATNSGVVTTPLVVTLAIGAALIGQVIAVIGRYQVIAIIGSAIMVFGMFLLTGMTASTSTLEVTRNMIVLGLGIGLVQPVLTLAVQNAIPRNMLGVGTSAVTYLRSLGATLGTAVLGTIIANRTASELVTRLPSGATQLPPKVLALATNQQVLISASARHGLVQGAVQAATANVPAGPQHDAITAQVTALFGQIFEATRQSEALGLQNAFVVAMIVAGLALVVTLFLKDVPLGTRATAPAPAAANATQAAEIGLEGATGVLPGAALAGLATNGNGATNDNLFRFNDEPIALGHLVAEDHPADTYPMANGNGHGVTAPMGLERSDGHGAGTAYARVPQTAMRQIADARGNEQWYERFMTSRHDMENVVVGFFLAHPEYLPPGQRSASRFTLDLLDRQFMGLEEAMRQAEQPTAARDRVAAE